jgi:hypothetical protein
MTHNTEEWRYECDCEATRAAYAATERGGAASCDCNGCRNFVAARSQIYPARFLELLEKLGIDPLKDAEAYHNARRGPGRHDYGGWFHFIGQLHGTSNPAVIDFGDGFTASFGRASAPCLTAFRDMSLVQLDFHATAVPWVLDEPEPE